MEKELLREDYFPSAVEHFLAVCAGWLIGHTLTEDRAITGGKTSKWGELLPEENLTAMEEIILDLIQSMFHLKAQVISNTYELMIFLPGNRNLVSSNVLIFLPYP